ncbi:hypothetical protein GCM10023152_25950 [Agromyces bauzanensis]
MLAQPAYLASQVSRYGRREFERALGERGLRLIHHGVLTALDDFGPLAQQQLADSLDHDKSHLVRHIDHLESHSLVTRVPDPIDRRRNQVAITDAGRAVLRELRTAERRSQQGLLDALTPEEQQALESLLRRVLVANDSVRLGARQEA